MKLPREQQSMLPNSIGKTILHQIQHDVVLEECLCPGKHPRESAGGIEGLLNDLILVSTKTLIRHADERCAIRPRRENPFHCSRTAVPRTLDEDARILLNGLYIQFGHIIVPFPVPNN